MVPVLSQPSISSGLEGNLERGVPTMHKMEAMVEFSEETQGLQIHELFGDWNGRAEQIADEVSTEVLRVARVRSSNSRLNLGGRRSNPTTR